MGKERVFSTTTEVYYPGREEMEARFLKHPSRAEILKYLEQTNLPLGVLFAWPEQKGGKLVDLGILRHIIAGNVVVYPFCAAQLRPNSYDVALGEHIYRWRGKKNSSLNSPVQTTHFLQKSAVNKGFLLPPSVLPSSPRLATYNPFDERSVKSVWRYDHALTTAEIYKNHGVEFVRVEPSDKIILLYPHEMILAHTEEFIGGVNVVVPEISGKSTSGRNLIEMCSDAKMGNIGFVNRYTLEVFNKTPEEGGLVIPLVVGQTYASFEFTETQEAPAKSYDGQYAKGVDIDSIVAEWVPEMMLPKMKRLVKV